MNSNFSFTHDLKTGTLCALGGFKEVFGKKLRPYLIIPLLINIIVFGALFYFGLYYVLNKLDVLFGYLSFDLPNWLRWLGFIFSLLKMILIVLVSLVLLLGASILSVLSANLFAAPFNGLLSEAYSKALGHPLPERPLVDTALKTLSREFVKIFHYLPRLLLVFLISAIIYFIPPLNLLIPVIIGWYSAWLMAIEYIDYAADNHHVPFKEMLAKLKERKWLCLSFGLTIALLSGVPLLNLLAMPAAVVGATRLWHENMGKVS